MPVGSVWVFVFWIGSVIATTLKCRVGEPAGQRPSSREANGFNGPFVDGAVPPFSPSHGAPECPFGENGGRSPTCGRMQRARRSPVDRVEHDLRPVTCRRRDDVARCEVGDQRARMARVDVRQVRPRPLVLGLAEVDGRERVGAVDRPVPDRRVLVALPRRPAAAAAARIQSSRFVGRDHRAVERLADQAGGVDRLSAGGTRSGSGTRSGCDVS